MADNDGGTIKDVTVKIIVQNRMMTGTTFYIGRLALAVGPARCYPPRHQRIRTLLY